LAILLALQSKAYYNFREQGFYDRIEGEISRNKAILQKFMFILFVGERMLEPVWGNKKGEIHNNTRLAFSFLEP
jgi:hypothetical protein